MVTKKDWGGFRSTGLVLIINQILHVFGWAIVFDVKDGEVKNVYPARVRFRGFCNDDTSEAYSKVSEYMKNHSDELYKETID